MSYLKGQVVRLRVHFTDPENQDARVQPSSVTVKVQDPAGSESSHTPTFDSSDTSFYYDLTVSSAGTWYYRAEASGSYVAAGEKAITVKASEF